ncbi:MAG: GntR family transcriptional regulator [Pseudomonadota bacterium]|nr:GntR family transcriptional regulator [Pseudomonadota bacterium]
MSKRQAPRYEQLADELRRAIRSGQFDTDATFPTENALCEHYGVSRFTVREALRCLQNDRLISRRRGSGTVVEPRSVRESARFQAFSSLDASRQYAADARMTLARDGEAALPRSLAAFVEAQHTALHKGKWARLRGLLTQGGGDDHPVAAIEAYVRPDLAHLLERVDLDSRALFRQLESHGDFTIGRVIQQIASVPASIAMAKALGIPRRTPCLRIVRVYHDSDGVPFEITNTHHPGEAFAYSMVIEPEQT